MKNLIKVNPFECRMWRLHDRLDNHINETTCRAEIESILNHGQVVPALGRPLPQGDPKHKIELIYGARRLFVACHLNQPLLIDLRELSDREAIVAMDVENRLRKDLSPYERGLSYAKWLEVGHFRSQEDIAHALKLSASQVSRMLKIAQLPSGVLDAFKSPTELCEAWGLKLAEALEDPARRQATLRQARAIADMESRPPASEVYRRLLAAPVKGRKVAKKAHDEVVKDTAGEPLFRIKQMPHSISVLIPTEKVSRKSLGDIRSAVADILQSERAAASTGEKRSVEKRLRQRPDASKSPLVSVAQTNI